MNKKLFVFPVFGLLTWVPAIPGIINQPITVVVANVFGAALTVVWIVAAAVVIIAFVVAGFKFLTAQGDPGHLGQARQAVIWGLVGTLIIILAWSMLAFVRNQIGV